MKISNEDRTKIALEYLINGKAASKLAIEYDIDRSTISKIVRKYQEQHPYIKSKSQMNLEAVYKNKENIAKIHRLHNVSLTKLAALYDIDRTTIAKVIKEIV